MENRVIGWQVRGGFPGTGAVQVGQAERRAVMAEAGKLFPVYTWHADELMRVFAVADRIVKRYGRPDETEKFQVIRRVRERLQQVAETLQECPGEIAYLSGRDRDLVRKAAEWLEKHPEC